MQAALCRPFKNYLGWQHAAVSCYFKINRNGALIVGAMTDDHLRAHWSTPNAQMREQIQGSQVATYNKCTRDNIGCDHICQLIKHQPLLLLSVIGQGLRHRTSANSAHEKFHVLCHEVV